MSTFFQNTPQTHIDHTDFKTVFDMKMTDYPIKGVMVTAEKEYSDLLFSSTKLDENTIKLDVLKVLVEEMFRANCVAFTHQSNLLHSTRIVKARTFCVPSDAVQLLRTFKK